jgi:ribonuclease HI
VAKQKNRNDIAVWSVREFKETDQIPKHFLVFSDGGARGNPGPAAIAFIIRSLKGETLAKNSRYVGMCTNNQAEYKALLAALEASAALRADTVTCHLDSELVVKQLNGEYRVKNIELKALWQRVRETRKLFREAKFVNVPRSHRVIEEVDELVNLTLDTRTK